MEGYYIEIKGFFVSLMGSLEILQSLKMERSKWQGPRYRSMGNVVK